MMKKLFFYLLHIILGRIAFFVLAPKNIILSGFKQRASDDWTVERLNTNHIKEHNDGNSNNVVLALYKII
jgi:hypothetical protein